MPTATGQFQFSVKVTDASGYMAIGSFSLSIYPSGVAPPPGFNFNTNLGTWSIGQVDGQQLTGNGGNGTYTFSFEGGRRRRGSRSGLTCSRSFQPARAA